MKLNSPRFTGPKEIKAQLAALLARRGAGLKGKTVIDLPAGSGHTSRQLKDLGADVVPVDLYPELFQYPDMECVKGNLLHQIPLADGSADMVLCQEGIEHLPNQLAMFHEFNRLLKDKGRILLTTPNYSSLRTRMSYFLMESEQYKIMPPNELDSIWLSEGARHLDDVYYGHIFFANLTRMRVLARLSGFRLREVHSARVNYTAMALYVLFIPFILLFNYRAYRRALRKQKDHPMDRKKAVYGELLRMNLNMNVLTAGHLIVEFEKESALDQVIPGLKGKIASFTEET